MPVRITNAAAVYMIMVLLFAAGMWAILAYGSTLRAPIDLAGEWQFVPQGKSAEPRRAFVEQSGRFVRLRIVGGQTFDLRIPKEDVAKAVDDPRTKVRLIGQDVTVTLEDSPLPDLFTVVIEQPNKLETFNAQIVTRTYPRRARSVNQNEAAPVAPKPSTRLAPISTPTHAP